MISDIDFSGLARIVGDRLIRVGAPADLERLRNPFAIEDEPGAFHTTGWFGAFDSAHSAVAVAAESAADIAAAVTFARERRLGLVVKGTGHDYLGRSSAPGALLVWTHRMRDITVHDAFVPAGAPSARGVPAVTVGAGTRWLEVYQALAARGRFVQGGGCTSVGAAGGFTLGGGYGMFSRRYGTAAGNVLEAEVVTASGEILVASETRHPDLFWALRGGGGGTFGVVARLTMRTHPMPESVAMVSGTIRAATDADFRRLVRALVSFVPALCDDHWGEQITLGGNTAGFFLTAVGLTADAARETCRPLLSWAAGSDAFSTDMSVAEGPAGAIWDPDRWDQTAPDAIVRDRRAGQPPGQFWWSGNQGEVSMYMDAYASRWLPARLFADSPDDLAAALVAAARHWPVVLHLNKGLHGASPEAVARDRATAVNPAVFDAAALLIAASAQQYAYPGIPGHEPDFGLAAGRACGVGRAMEPIRALTPDAGSYLNEADYFEPGWQQSFWGANYPRLLRIKRAYDPANLFRVHHGVGTE